MTKANKFARLLCATLVIGGLSSCADLLGPQKTAVAKNDLRIYARADGTFEILARPGTAGPQYFCAAGDYARTRLNASPAARVEVTRIDGPSDLVPGRRSMVFAMAPPGPRTLPVVTNLPMWVKGASLTVAHAQLLCREGVRPRELNTL